VRNVWILTLAQAFSGCGTIMLVAFGGIAGARMAALPALATLPVSMAIVGLAIMSIPAALLMQRIGRKRAFVGSAAVAGLAALLCAWSVASGAFLSLCVAGLLLGANMAFVQQYRFAATEFLPQPQAGRAVSTVMLGTLGATLLGPTLGSLGKDLGGWPEFTGSFLILAVLCVVAMLILLSLGNAPPRSSETDTAGRPLRAIAAQPDYRAAVLIVLVAYAVMSFIMTATPISMHVHDGFSSGETTTVITAHLLGMYLPSLATPWIVQHLGIRTMMLVGIAAMAMCILISAAIGHAFVHYFSGLVLLGFGWNLMFVAGTTLLTTTYRASERFRAQGLNDFAIFGTQAVASLLAGSAIQSIGWSWVNLVCLPLLLIVALVAGRTRLSAATR
jgi:MFS family permease